MHMTTSEAIGNVLQHRELYDILWRDRPATLHTLLCSKGIIHETTPLMELPTYAMVRSHQNWDMPYPPNTYSLNELGHIKPFIHGYRHKA